MNLSKFFVIPKQFNLLAKLKFETKLLNSSISWIAFNISSFYLSHLPFLLTSILTILNNSYINLKPKFLFSPRG